MEEKIREEAFVGEAFENRFVFSLKEDNFAVTICSQMPSTLCLNIKKNKLFLSTSREDGDVSQALLFFCLGFMQPEHRAHVEARDGLQFISELVRGHCHLEEPVKKRLMNLIYDEWLITGKLHGEVRAWIDRYYTKNPTASLIFIMNLGLSLYRERPSLNGTLSPLLRQLTEELVLSDHQVGIRALLLDRRITLFEISDFLHLVAIIAYRRGSPSVQIGTEALTHPVFLFSIEGSTLHLVVDPHAVKRWIAFMQTSVGKAIEPLMKALFFSLLSSMEGPREERGGELGLQEERFDIETPSAFLQEVQVIYWEATGYKVNLERLSGLVSDMHASYQHSERALFLEQTLQRYLEGDFPPWNEENFDFEWVKYLFRHQAPQSACQEWKKQIEKRRHIDPSYYERIENLIPSSSQYALQMVEFLIRQELLFFLPERAWEMIKTAAKKALRNDQRGSSVENERARASLIERLSTIAIEKRKECPANFAEILEALLIASQSPQRRELMRVCLDENITLSKTVGSLWLEEIGALLESGDTSSRLLFEKGVKENYYPPRAIHFLYRFLGEGLYEHEFLLGFIKSHPKYRTLDSGAFDLQWILYLAGKGKRAEAESILTALSESSQLETLQECVEHLSEGRVLEEHLTNLMIAFPYTPSDKAKKEKIAALLLLKSSPPTQRRIVLWCVQGKITLPADKKETWARIWVETISTWIKEGDIRDLEALITAGRARGYCSKEQAQQFNSQLAERSVEHAQTPDEFLKLCEKLLVQGESPAAEKLFPTLLNHPEISLEKKWQLIQDCGRTAPSLLQRNISEIEKVFKEICKRESDYKSLIRTIKQTPFFGIPSFLEPLFSHILALSEEHVDKGSLLKGMFTLMQVYPRALSFFKEWHSFLIEYGKRHLPEVWQVTRWIRVQNIESLIPSEHLYSATICSLYSAKSAEILKEMEPALQSPSPISNFPIYYFLIIGSLAHIRRAEEARMLYRIYEQALDCADVFSDEKLKRIEMEKEVMCTLLKHKEKEIREVGREALSRLTSRGASPDAALYVNLIHSIMTQEWRGVDLQVQLHEIKDHFASPEFLNKPVLMRALTLGKKEKRYHIWVEKVVLNSWEKYKLEGGSRETLFMLVALSHHLLLPIRKEVVVQLNKSPFYKYKGELAMDVHGVGRFIARYFKKEKELDANALAPCFPLPLDHPLARYVIEFALPLVQARPTPVELEDADFPYIGNNRLPRSMEELKDLLLFLKEENYYTEKRLIWGAHCAIEALEKKVLVANEETWDILYDLLKKLTLYDGRDSNSIGAAFELYQAMRPCYVHLDKSKEVLEVIFSLISSAVTGGFNKAVEELYFSCYQKMLGLSEDVYLDKIIPIFMDCFRKMHQQEGKSKNKRVYLHAKAFLTALNRGADYHIELSTEELVSEYQRILRQVTPAVLDIPDAYRDRLAQMILAIVTNDVVTMLKD